MTKPKMPKIFKGAQIFVSKHSPEILTGIGIAGMITTTVLAVKATPKAMQLIEEKKKTDRMDKLSPIDTIKVAWKPYIPAAITGVTSVACLIGACSASTRRNAALATAYQISQTALTEYKEKVVETIGEKKEEIVKDKIAKDRIEKKPVSKSEIFMTEKGNTLCYDAISGRYFKSDIEQIKRAMNQLNKMILSNMYASLNDFYDELGLNHINLGDNLGWNVDDSIVDVEFSSQIADDGTPCIVMDYSKPPKYDYAKFF